MGSGVSAGRGGPAEGSLLETAPQGFMLNKLFQMTDGDKWIKKDGWIIEDTGYVELGEPDFKTFFGLGINKYNSVIRISLPRNNLAGQLPFSEKFVKALRELRTIDLESNRIGGTFPSTWCLMSNLTDLNLTRNGIRGTFPDAIGNLIALKKLKLGQNQLHGALPMTMSKLTELTRLELHRNRLCAVPDMLGNLSKLHTLKINENLFTGELPDAWVMLESIRELYIFSNHFKLFDNKPKHFSFSGSNSKQLTAQNLKVLDVLRKRCHILVMLEDQVGDGGFIADRLPDRETWPEQPHLYGNGFESVKMHSHDDATLAHLAKIRNEERDVSTY